MADLRARLTWRLALYADELSHRHRKGMRRQVGRALFRVAVWADRDAR